MAPCFKFRQRPGKTDKQTKRTKLRNTRPLIGMVLWKNQFYISMNIYIMLLEIIQAHDFVQLFVLISQWEDLYVQLHTQSGTHRTREPVIPPFWAVSFKRKRFGSCLFTSAGFPFFVSKCGEIYSVYFANKTKPLSPSGSDPSWKKKHQVVATVSLSLFNKILFTVYFKKHCCCCYISGPRVQPLRGDCGFKTTIF